MTEIEVMMLIVRALPITCTANMEVKDGKEIYWLSKLIYNCNKGSAIKARTLPFHDS